MKNALFLTVLALFVSVLFAPSDVNASENSVAHHMDHIQFEAKEDAIGTNNANENNAGAGTDGNEGQGLGNNSGSVPPTASELTPFQMMMVGLFVMMGVVLVVRKRDTHKTA